MAAIRKYFFAPILCVLVLASSAANAGDKPARELYVKSGLQHTVDQLPEMVASQLGEAIDRDQGLQKLPGEVIAEIKTVMARSFGAERLEGAILREFEAKMSPDEMRTVLEWLETPLGKKCTQLEMEASGPETMARVAAYAAELTKTPAQPQRLTLIRELDEKSGITEAAAVIMVGVQMASMAAVIPLVPAENRKSLADVSKQLDEDRPKLEAALKPVITAQLLYTYRALSDAEIEKYIDFIGSDTGLKYSRVGIAGFQKGFFEAAAQGFQSVAEVIESAKKRSGA